MSVRCGSVAVVLVLAGCISQQFKSSNTLIASADASYAGGDYDAAERDYRQAIERAEGAGGLWARTEAERGLGKIAIARARQKAPAVAAQVGSHAGTLAELHALRRTVRENGGDDAVEAEIVALVERRAGTWIDEAEARAARGELLGAATDVRALLAVRDAPAAVIARARALRARAASESTARALEAGDAHPMLRRMHLGIAAAFGGETPPSADELLAPFQRGVEITVRAPAGCGMGAVDALRSTGAMRRVSVVIEVATCAPGSDTSYGTERVKWIEQVSRGFETYTATEYQCRKACSQVPTGGETCDTNYNTNPPSLLCRKDTREACIDVCGDVPVQRQREVFDPVERTGERKVTTETSSLSFAATWAFTRDGAITRDSTQATPSTRRVSAPAMGTVPARSEGSYATPSELVAQQANALRDQLARGLDRIFQRDVDAAIATARAAAGRRDDEEEAWLRVIALGGQDAGPLAARYATDRAGLLGHVMNRNAAVPDSTWELPDAKVFAQVERGESNQITERDLTILERSAPVTFAGRYAVQFETAYLSAPVVHDVATNRDVSGDSGFLVGVRGAVSILDRKRSKWGFRLADEGTMSFALGGRTGGPELGDVPLGSFAGTFDVSYAIGAGYRRPGFGGLFGGVRGSYNLFLVGATTGSYKTLPLFVRGEAATIYGTFAAEVLGASLLGRSHLGLTLNFAKTRAEASDWATYLQLRIERTSFTPTVTDFDNPTYVDGSSTLADQELTAVYFLIGKGS